VNLAPDERLLIVGASGVGKSSILRAVAGLWSNGVGIVVRPDIREMIFLPQRPYMVLGTLREQLLYPKNDETLSNDQLQKVLERVNLGYLTNRFNWDEILDWPMVLSLGEQQRLAFARIFLSQPRYAILDEATSALDVANERHLYRELQQTEVVYLSVGHRPTLVDYHQKVLELTGGGAWQVWTAAEYRAKLAQMVS
jgi:putative ATP-binding cassette transporter